MNSERTEPSSPTPEGGGQESRIEQSHSFDELIEILRAMGTIRGSDGKEYGTERMAHIIEVLREAAKDSPQEDSIFLREITRAWGLRNKVIELLKQERREQPEN